LGHTEDTFHVIIYLLTLSPHSMLTCKDINSFTMLSCPFCDATCRGVIWYSYRTTQLHMVPNMYKCNQEQISTSTSCAYEFLMQYITASYHKCINNNLIATYKNTKQQSLLEIMCDQLCEKRSYSFSNYMYLAIHNLTCEYVSAWNLVILYS